jgi:hypothetical protein
LQTNRFSFNFTPKKIHSLAFKDLLTAAKASEIAGGLQVKGMRRRWMGKQKFAVGENQGSFMANSSVLSTLRRRHQSLFGQKSIRLKTN